MLEKGKVLGMLPWLSVQDHKQTCFKEGKQKVICHRSRLVGGIDTVNNGGESGH